MLCASMAYSTSPKRRIRGILKHTEHHELNDEPDASDPTESGDDADSESSDSYIVDYEVMSDVEYTVFSHDGFIKESPTSPPSSNDDDE